MCKVRHFECCREPAVRGLWFLVADSSLSSRMVLHEGGDMRYSTLHTNVKPNRAGNGADRLDGHLQKHLNRSLVTPSRREYISNHNSRSLKPHAMPSRLVIRPPACFNTSSPLMWGVSATTMFQQHRSIITTTSPSSWRTRRISKDTSIDTTLMALHPAHAQPPTPSIRQPPLLAARRECPPP